MQMHNSSHTVMQSAHQAASRRDELSLPLCSHNRLLSHLMCRHPSVELRTLQTTLKITDVRGAKHIQAFMILPNSRSFVSCPRGSDHNTTLLLEASGSSVPVHRVGQTSILYTCLGFPRPKGKYTCAELGRVLVRNSTRNSRFM